MIGGQTLAPGGLAIIISNTSISLAADAADAVVGSSTIQIVRPASPATASPANATVLTIGKSVYAADASSNFVIGGQTVSPDAAITVAGAIITSGTSLSYPSGGIAVVIGTNTEALSYATITSSSAATITFDGSTNTANTSSNFVIAGQTLAPGGVITVSSTPISYAAAGTDIVVGSSTEAIGLGGLIMNGFGSGVGHSLAGQYLEELLRMEF